MKLHLIVLLIIISFPIWAQFPAPVGQVGTTAIHKDSSIIVAWASNCQVNRGYLDISNPSLGFASLGSGLDALGPAGEGGLVSLGDGGMATLEFRYPIKNGPGPDFAVFENAFNDSFLELAFVEVSSDGQVFVRFPAISNSDTSTQIGSFGSTDARNIHNLAGKYRANYGTPFDLEDLKDSVGLDLNNIHYVRIIDVVGCIQPQYARRDSRGVIINDPWSTPWESAGFDLDAIGVIHQNESSSLAFTAQSSLKVYPNPVSKSTHKDFLVKIEDQISPLEKQLAFYSPNGRLVFSFLNFMESTRIDIAELPNGIYYLQLEGTKAIPVLIVD